MTESTESLPQNRDHYGLGVTLTLILLVGISIIIRVRGLSGDLWLDEIWAISIAQTVDHWSAIITSLHRDNNHYLASLTAWILGEGAAPELYRLPSIVFSFATLLAAVRISRTWLSVSAHPSFSVVVMLLFGTSFVMTLYGTEARGYAGMLAAVLWTFSIAQNSLWGIGSLLGFLFWCSVGLLSHPTFAFFYLPLVGYAWCQRVDSGRAALRCTVGLLVPLVATLMFYLLDWRHIPPGSGTRYSYSDVIFDTFGASVGLPPLSPSQLEISAAIFIADCLVGLLLLRGLVLLWRERPIDATFFLLVIVVVPATILIALQPRVLYVRYLLFAMPCILFLLAYVFARDLQRGGLARAAALVAVTLVVIGHAYHLACFFRDGRGSYEEVLTYLQSRSENGIVRFDSDQRFRANVIIDFYAPRLGLSGAFQYVTTGCPDWHLAHTQDWGAVPALALQHECGHRFDIVGETRTVPYSGWRWFVYRRAG